MISQELINQITSKLNEIGITYEIGYGTDITVTGADTYTVNTKLACGLHPPITQGNITLTEILNELYFNK